MEDVHENFKKKVDRLNRQADACLESISSNFEDREYVYAQLRMYLKCRFVLEDEDMDSDDLSVLAELSIQRMLNEHSNEDLSELSAGCMGESSAMTKRILFIMVLRRRLGIKADAEAFGAAATVRQLSEEICNSLAK